MSAQASWIVVAEDGEYLISADMAVGFRMTFTVRVNQQVVVERHPVFDWALGGSYPIPMPKHIAVLHVRMPKIDVSFGVHPKYKLVIDDVEIPTDQRIVL